MLATASTIAIIARIVVKTVRTGSIGTTNVKTPQIKSAAPLLLNPSFPRAMALNAVV